MYKYKRLFSAIGFYGYEDLLNSLVRPKNVSFFMNLSLIGASIEFIFGLKPFLFTALFILLLVELITGLVASKLKGRKLTSRRLQRFGVMILIWLTLLLVMNALVFQYEGKAEQYIANYMHSTLVFYISGIYMKSILENAETIWDNKINVKSLINQLFKFNKNETDNPPR